MARIRALKIGFFTNEALAEFSPWHRLLFAGLWCLADRAGRLEYRPKRIKASLFPYNDPVDVEGIVTDLCAGPDPFLVRYKVNGQSYLVIRKFKQHQRPHHTEPESVIPGPNTPKTVRQRLSHGETTVSTPCEHGETTVPARLGNGEWVMGKGNGEVNTPPTPLLGGDDYEQVKLANAAAMTPVRKKGRRKR